MLASYSTDNMDEGVINLVSSIFFDDENNEVIIDDEEIEEDIIDIINDDNLDYHEDNLDCDFLPFSKEFLEIKRERAFSWDVSFEQSVTHEVDDIATKQALLFDHEEALVIKTSNKRKAKTENITTEPISKRSRSSSSRKRNDIDNPITPVSNNLSTPRAPGRRKSYVNNNNINEYDIVDVFAADNETNRNTQTNKYSDKVSTNNSSNFGDVRNSNTNSTVKNISWSADVQSPNIKGKVADSTPTTAKISSKSRGRTPPSAATAINSNTGNQLPIVPAVPFSVPIAVPSSTSTSTNNNTNNNNNDMGITNFLTTTVLNTCTNTMVQIPNDPKVTTTNTTIMDDNNLITPMANSCIVNEALIGVDGRIGAYTKDERKIKIDKFRERKRSRIWRKQIKYDCRKRLADTRPRVKGRFVSRKGEDGKPLPPDMLQDSSINNNSINNNNNIIQATVINGAIATTTSNNNNANRRRNTKKSVGNNNKMALNGVSQIKQIQYNPYPAVNNNTISYNTNVLIRNNNPEIQNNNNNKVSSTVSTAGYNHLQQSGGYGISAINNNQLNRAYNNNVN